MLDPGHGGTDNGVRSPSGESEKNIALGIAEELGSYLEIELGARVLLTRGGDGTVALESRTSLANQYEADLFVSLHVSAGDAPMPGSAFQTWVLDPPPVPFQEEASALEGESAPSARVLEDGSSSSPTPRADSIADDPADLDAESADDEPPVAIPRLERWDRVHDGELERSALLARLIQARVGDVLDLPNRDVQRAPLRVLTGASMPAVLIEFGYEEVEQEKTPVFDGPRGREVFEAIGRAIRLYRGATTVPAETVDGMSS